MQVQLTLRSGTHMGTAGWAGAMQVKFLAQGNATTRAALHP